MPYLHPPELALSDCLGLCQRNRQVKRPTIDESDMKYWLTGTGSGVQTNESSAAQETGMNREAKDVKPSQTTDLPPRHPSRSFDGSFECGERHRWNGHGSMNEVERWTGSDADARRSAEAEVDRVRQDSKFEDMNDQEVTEGGTCRQTSSVETSGVDEFAVAERLVPSGIGRDGEMLLRWSIQSLEDPWHLGRSGGILQ